MNHRQIGAVLCAAWCFALVGAIATFANRQDAAPVTQQLVPAQAGFSFSWGSGRVNDLVGATVRVHTETVPVELVGLTCTLSGSVNATESVHPGNVLHVSTNGDTFDVLAVEDVANSDLTFGGTGELADQIFFDVTLGDGDASPNRQTTSITGTASVTCLLPTTTSSSTTSTPPSESTTSTTAPPTPPSEPPSSTTQPPPATPPSTSTVPPSTPPPTISTPSSTSIPPSISLDGDVICPPGTYDAGAGTCLAVEEDG